MKKIYIIFILLLGFHLLVLSRLQFTAWPEMLSFPYMVNNGLTIYKDFHHAYQPLLTIVLSFVYKMFGYKLLVLQVFTWALILISDILIFKISLRAFGRKISALIPVSIFVLLQPFFEGNMLWFDLATVPLILSSIYFIFKKNLFWSGFFIALAILIKQQIVLLLIGYFIYFWFQKVKFREFLHFAIGGVVPVTISLILLWINGVLSDYFFWTLLFPLKYLPGIPGYAMWPATKQILVLIVLALPFMILVRKKERSPEVLFLGILFLTTIAASFPRFSYFHLQPMLAVYSVMLGVVVVPQKRLFLLIVPVIVFLYVFKQSLIFWRLPARFYDSEAISLAKIVSREVNINEKVYFLGPNSLAYVLSGTIPPKPWIENYVWHFEVPGVQQKMIEGWKKDSPSVIFWSDPITGNWFDVGVYQPKEIVDWIRKNYVKKLEVEPQLWVWRHK